MSDGSSGNAFGEALESMTTNTKKAIGGTIADFKNSTVKQVSGNQQAGVSGSFSPGQVPANPNTAPGGLQGGDLFSPDMTKAKPQNQQIFQGQQPLTTAGQKLMSSQDIKSPEEIAKIQSIEAELKTLHQKYYQDFEAKATSRDKKTQIKEEEKKQEEQQEKQMEDLQKQQKKQEDQAVFRAQRGSEIKGGGVG